MFDVLLPAVGLSRFNDLTFQRFDASPHSPGLFSIFPNSLSSGSISILPDVFPGIAAGADSTFLSGLATFAGAGGSAGTAGAVVSIGSLSGGSGF